MKKYFALLMIMYVTNCYSQGLVPITFGPMASMTSTSLSSDPDFKDEIAGAGYNAGAFIRLKVFILYVQGEVSYSSNNTSLTYEVNGSSANSERTYKLKGTDVSLLAGLKLLGLSDMGFVRVFAGYKWSNYTDISYSEGGSVFSASNVNTKNQNIIAGLGVDVWKFTIDLKYLIGLSDIATSPDFNVKTKEVDLCVGYKFR